MVANQNPSAPNDGERLVCFSLDLEYDFGGRTGTAQTFEDLASFERLAEIVRRYELKLSVFVVGDMLDKSSEDTHGIVERLADLGAEFELHAYKHDLTGSTDQGEDIRRGRAAFRGRFGRDPRGYRAPAYRISEREIKVLATEGFSYDSSILPAFTRIMSYDVVVSTEPHYVKGLPILELPPGVIPIVRLPMSLSYIKLMGPNVYRALIRLFGLPSSFVFSCHLHDLFPIPAYKQLPRIQKLKWMRNRKRGIEIFETSIERILSKGYRPGFMSELFDIAKNGLPEPGPLPGDKNAGGGAGSS